MMNNTESPEGIFAIIDDDSQDVIMLYFYSLQGDLKREDGEWRTLLLSDDDLLEDAIQVPVIEDAVKMWDSAERTGRILNRADIERFKIKLEQ